MKTQIRYKAFTLLEITIAMLIAAVCIEIALYVLGTFTQLGEKQQREKQREYLLQLFCHRLERETVMANYIRFVDNCLLLEVGHKQTVYIFRDSALVRIQEGVATDTLIGLVDGLLVEYVPNITPQFVRLYSFELHVGSRRYPFMFQKEYSAENLIHLTQEQ